MPLPISDAPVEVRQQERSRTVPAPSRSTFGATGSGARQAAVARALADELRIDATRVSDSITQLRQELLLSRR